MREKGLAGFSGSFESQSATPIDARQIVGEKADLFLDETWRANDGKIYIYKGISVSVHSDPDETNNGLYLLKRFSYRDAANWEKIGGSGVISDAYTKAQTDAALALKADKANTYTKLETDARIQSVVGAAPAALDTLQEIAAQLQSDETAAGALTILVGKKANTTDMTAALLTKADAFNTYTKSEVDSKIASIPVVDVSGKVDTTVFNNALSLKTDKATTYSMTQVDTIVNGIDIRLSNDESSVAALITVVNDKADKAIVTETTNGLMSALDKVKLDNIANKYFELDFTNSSSVTVTHNLACYPTVRIIEADLTEVSSQIDYIDTMKLKVSFNYPITGKIICS